MKQLLDHYRHVAARAFDTPLLMEPNKLRTICELVIAPRLAGTGVAPAPAVDSRVTTARRDRGLRVVDGVAIVDVIGTLVQRSSWIDALSGLVSYEQIEAELETAMDRSEVRGILLRVDSPGGEVGGAFDLADRIRALSSVKPIWAIAEDLAASAGYLLASSAEKLLITQTGVVGSIGVVLAHFDQSEYDKQRGVQVTEFYAGRRKIDFSPHSALTDERRAAIQETVDEFYQLFVAKAARNRGLSEEAIRGTEAGIYVGQAGVDYGLADGVTTLERARKELTALVRPPAATSAAAEPAGPDGEEFSETYRKVAREAAMARRVRLRAPDFPDVPADRESDEQREIRQTLEVYRRADGGVLDSSAIDRTPTP